MMIAMGFEGISRLPIRREQIQTVGSVHAIAAEHEDLVTTEQTSGCMLSKSVALDWQRMECVPFERDLNCPVEAIS